jgi:hypothetical protein
LDSLVDRAIVPAWVASRAAAACAGAGAAVVAESAEAEARAAWDDWRGRLWHPHFGLSTYFITQNGPAKGGIRIGPTVRDLLLLPAGGGGDRSPGGPSSSPVPVTVAYALAALLRWLTPGDPPPARDSAASTGETGGGTGPPGRAYRGWLQQGPRTPAADGAGGGGGGAVEYADGLRYHLGEGWYEFRCACVVSRVSDPDATAGSDWVVLSEWLGGLPRPAAPSAYAGAVRAYLESPEGGGLPGVAAPGLDALVGAVAALYARMVAGDDLLEILAEMKAGIGPYRAEGMATSCSALVEHA